MDSATTFRTSELRAGAAAMLGAALVWPVLPVHPPLACPLRTLTGIPCPFCGMTRAVVAALHGHVIASLRFNPGGIVVVLIAVGLLAGLRIDRLRAHARSAAWIIGALTLALWAWNIGFNPTFR